jgi:signal transduction histidine kinase
VINYLEIALEQPLDDRLKQNLSSAQSSSKSLIHVIDDLLNLTGSDSSDTIPDLFDAFDLRKMIQEVMEPLRHFAERKMLEFEYIEGPGVHQHVRGEMVPIQRSLTNLITNAITYTDKGKVTVEWTRIQMEDSDVTRLSVKDTGIGIAEQGLDQLFQDLEQIVYDGSEPGQQGKEDLKMGDERSFNMGLGLASVCKFIPLTRIYCT